MGGDERPLPTRSVELIELGPLELRLDPPFIKDIRANGVELLRAVYVAVRDHNWGTVAAEVTVVHKKLSEHNFDMRFRCRHDNTQVGFVWDGQVLCTTGPDSARLSYSLRGHALRDFTGNRVGFCLLHPAALAGTAVSLETSAGTVTSNFPASVSPGQPFADLAGLSYSLGDVALSLRLEGETFETEDQRNWTDASFKTYCPPLSVPYPRRWQAGEEVVQQVVMDFRLNGKDEPRARRSSSHRRVSVRLGPPTSARLPGIGVAAPQSGPRVEGAGLEALRRLRLNHLHVVVDLGRSDWEGTLGSDLDFAHRLGLPAQCEVVVDEPAQLDQVTRVLARVGGERSAEVAAVMLFDRATSVTTPDLVSAWGKLARERSFWPLYGGSRANFAELNRAALSYQALSGVTFAVNPQVHAFSDEEIVQTLEVHELLARQARERAGGLLLHVGPITLLPRFNAVATEPLAWAPPPADPREGSMLTAAWALGSIAELSRSGATTLTYFETSGPGGLIEVAEAGVRRFPVYEVLSAFAGRGGAMIVTSEAGPHDAPLAHLALRDAQGLWLYLANLTADEMTLTVDEPGVIFAVKSFDPLITQPPSPDEEPGKGEGLISDCEPIVLGAYEGVALCPPDAGGGR